MRNIKNTLIDLTLLISLVIVLAKIVAIESRSFRYMDAARSSGAAQVKLVTAQVEIGPGE